MAQTRMFRDRVVSMEQTLEGGEKHLELLKALCRAALPEFDYRNHALDHERDLFVMELAAADGRKKTVSWTRMVLFDAERIPTLTADPASAIRDRLVGFLRERASRPDIVVTFRHLEEGWADTPEPRPSRRRGRRGGRGVKGPAFARATAGGGPGRPGPRGADKPSGAGPAARPQQPRAHAQAHGQPQGQGQPRPAPQAASGAPGVAGGVPGRPGRRRRRRRRHGGSGSGGASAPNPGPGPQRVP